MRDVGNKEVGKVTVVASCRHHGDTPACEDHVMPASSRELKCGGHKEGERVSSCAVARFVLRRNNGCVRDGKDSEVEKS